MSAAVEPDMASRKAPSARTIDERESRKAANAALVGTIVEYFEFGVYGYLAVVIGPLFFPGQSPVISLLSTLAVFGSSFFVRPLGGVILGRLGDHTGRRSILMLTVVGMGAATAATGMLPTYGAVGVLAPVLLLVCRLTQGFFAGGEVTGAAAYTAESSPSGKRAFYAGFVPMGAALGGAFAAATVGIVSSALGPQTMAAWGWRVPFLCAIPLIIVSLVIRANIEESPIFAEAKAHNTVVKAPLTEVITRHWKSVLKVIGLSFGQNTGYWVGLVFLSIHMTQNLGYSKTFVNWVVAVVSAIAGLATPFVGKVSDRIGRRKSLLLGFGGYAVLVFPTMALLELHNTVIAFAAMLLLAVPFPFVQSAGYSTYAEIFPTRVRYTGMSLSFNIGTILGGGLMPFAATGLIALTGILISPAFLLIGAAGVALATLLTVKETARAELVA